MSTLEKLSIVAIEIRESRTGWQVWQVTQSHGGMAWGEMCLYESESFAAAIGNAQYWTEKLYRKVA